MSRRPDPTEPVRLRSDGRRIWFVSDIHMGDGSFADVFIAKDAAFLAFLDEVERTGQALVVLGDALDFEQAWYFSRIVRAHRDVISRLTRLAERMPVIYVLGNHDPDVVLLQDILRWQVCTQVVIDDRLLGVHGYEFDRYVGPQMEASSRWTRAIHLYERLFRTWVRFPLREHYTLSNRLAHRLFASIDAAGRVLGAAGGAVGRPNWGAGLRDFVAFWTRAVLGDPMGITQPAVAMLRASPRFDHLVCGHSHVPGVVDLGGGRTYVNTGSWSFGNSQVGWWDGERFHLRDWISGRRIRAENYRPIFDGRADGTYRQWFEDQYLGWLRFRCGEEALREGVRPRPWVLEALDAPREDDAEGSLPPGR